jgi:hypothetical protein
MERIASTCGLLLALKALNGLSGWEYLDALAERVVGAIRGEESLSESDLKRLRTWPRRWLLLDPELKRFFGLALQQRVIDPSVPPVLFAILDRKALEEDWPRWRIRQLYSDLVGTEPGFRII